MGVYIETITDESGRYNVGPLDPGEDYILVAESECYSYKLFEIGTIPP